MDDSRIYEFGNGKRIVCLGEFDSKPAVFISAPKYNGVPGESADGVIIPESALDDGEIVMTFPTRRHSELVMSALCEPSVMAERFEGLQAQVSKFISGECICPDSGVVRNTPDKHWPGCPMITKLKLDACMPDVLFDGFSVYEALSHEAKARTRSENVSDVLDAIVRILRAEKSASKQASQSALPDIVYSTDDEFYPFDSMYDAVDAAYDGLAGGDDIVVIFEGEPIRYSASDLLPDISDVLRESAYDEGGEYTNDWPDAGPEANADLIKSVERAVDAWADRHGAQPCFYRVRRTKEITLRVRETATGLEWEPCDAAGPQIDAMADQAM